MTRRTFRLRPGLATPLRALGVLALVLVVLPASAAKVYQWKDANGVTHYTDTPPPGQKAMQGRDVDAPPAATPTAAAKAPEAENCVTARKNLTQLKGTEPVGLDADGDGKLDKVMSAEERAQQLKLTQSMLEVYCGKPAATP